MRSDAEIIEAVLAGQREVFADLVHRYEGAVRAVALAISRNHHTAQDVTQDTFVAAFEKLAALRDRSRSAAGCSRSPASGARRREARVADRAARRAGFADVSRNGQRTTNRANCSMRHAAAGARTDVVLMNYFAAERLRTLPRRPAGRSAP